MNDNQKTEKLNELRKKLEDLIVNYGNLTDPKVIRASRRLDALIFKHHKMFVKFGAPNKRG